MELANSSKLNEEARVQFEKLIAKKMLPAMNQIRDTIVAEELPSGEVSPIAKELVAVQTSPNSWAIQGKSRIWSYLNYGTGIYSDRHRGKGPGGEIVPLNAKALHFKNAELAVALGFPSEDVFLRSVKGIKPRFFLEKAFLTSRFNQAFQGILTPSGKHQREVARAVKAFKHEIAKVQLGVRGLKVAYGKAKRQSRQFGKVPKPFSEYRNLKAKTLGQIRSAGKR